MTDLEQMRIRLLGLRGFHGKTIAKMVRRYDGTSYSVGTIYATLRGAGVRLRDYRDGKTQEAKDTIRRVDTQLNLESKSKGAKNQKRRKAG